jgi:hypothetical protein
LTGWTDQEHFTRSFARGTRALRNLRGNSERKRRNNRSNREKEVCPREAALRQPHLSYCWRIRLWRSLAFRQFSFDKPRFQVAPGNGDNVEWGCQSLDGHSVRGRRRALDHDAQVLSIRFDFRDLNGVTSSRLAAHSNQNYHLFGEINLGPFSASGWRGMLSPEFFPCSGIFDHFTFGQLNAAKSTLSQGPHRHTFSHGRRETHYKQQPGNRSEPWHGLHEGHLRAEFPFCKWQFGFKKSPLEPFIALGFFPVKVGRARKKEVNG